MREQDNNLKSLTKCPLCKAKYNHSQAIVLEEGNNRTVFHLTCEKCGSAVLAFITEGKQGIISLGLATDLSSKEARIILKGHPIDKEEVLKIYKYLNNK
jgi:transcription elongation factor Elf1